MAHANQLLAGDGLGENPKYAGSDSGRLTLQPGLLRCLFRELRFTTRLTTRFTTRCTTRFATRFMTRFASPLTACA